MNEVIKTLQDRTSLRVYTDQPISAEVKELLFDCAMKAPTAGNQLLYSMIDVTSQSLKDQLAEYCDHQPFIAKAPMVVIFVADHQKWFDYYQLNDVHGYCAAHPERQFEAPQESDLFLAIEDAMIAAQNMVIAAESLGIGSCYIGDIVEHHEAITELLNLSEWTFPISMLVLGYRDPSKERIHRQRFDKQFVVFNNQYQRLTPEVINTMFAEFDSHFNPHNQVGAQNMAQQFYNRKTGASFAKEMARSVRVALKKWSGRLL